MAHNWPPPGGVDPLLLIEGPPTANQRREVVPSRSFRFFKRSTITKTAFEDPDSEVLDADHEIVFIDQGRTDENFESSRVIIVNNGEAAIEFSFGGTEIHGRLALGESVTMDERRERRVFIRKTGAGADPTIKVWAW